jgi:hypothetical protein
MVFTAVVYDRLTFDLASRPQGDQRFESVSLHRSVSESGACEVNGRGLASMTGLPN